MGRASSSKKVARAARTGGGRTKRAGSRTCLFPGVMIADVALGTLGIVSSKHQNSAAATVRPRRTDHWHAAYGFDICGKFERDLPQPTPLIGLHTHGDGVIHVEPQ